MMRRLFIVFLLFFSHVLLAGGQDVAISTNALDYANFATMNLEASYSLGRHWSLVASAKYNPFEFKGGDGPILQKQQLYSAGARFWPWHVYSGWWIAGKGRYQEFSRCEKGTTLTKEGDRYGGGISTGYGKMLGKHLNLDFGLGVWAGYSVYTSYACQHCGRVVDKGSGFFILPSDIMVALSYVF